MLRKESFTGKKEVIIQRVAAGKVQAAVGK
jgi:hypothetical protein